MKKERNASRAKPRYLDPAYHESAPEYILRCAPHNESAMRALLDSMKFGCGDIDDLNAAAERIEARVEELERRRAHPEIIERARGELNLLTLAKNVLCDG